MTHSHSPSLELCLRTLEEHGGNKTKAAASLGMSRSAFRMKIGQRGGDENLTALDEHRLVTENAGLKRQVRDLLDDMNHKDELLKVYNLLGKGQIKPPRWRKPGKTNKEIGIPTIFLSDTHFDEVVRPEQIGGVNEYNREIAQSRLREFFDNSISLTDHYIAGIEMPQATLALGGDIVGGIIHEELRETNSAPILDTCFYWAEQIAAGIKELRQVFDYIYIPAVVGNHGRLDRKPRHKNSVIDNFDYLIYRLLENHFKADKGIDFNIPHSRDVLYKLYNTRYLLTHGDQFKGGSGIAGLLSPLMLGDHRKRKRQASIDQPYDYMLMGHWHTYAHFRGIIVNGSLKGYDEFASNYNFDYEPPQQAYWITDPTRGKTICAPIHVT